MWTLIAGAGSGIGRALALELADRDAHLILAGRTRDKLESLASEIRKHNPGCRLVLVRADFSDPRSTQDLANAVTDRTNRLDRLIYCAGEGEPAPDLQGWNLLDFQRALAVNVSAPLLLVQSLYPQLCRHDGGARIVMLGAGMDTQVQKGTGSYGVSKMALRRLVRQLAVEFDADIRAPIISLFQPGLVDTEGLRDHLGKAERISLPHSGWLSERLDTNDCLTPEQAASALAFILNSVPDSDFHGAVFQGRDLVDSLSFGGS